MYHFLFKRNLFPDNMVQMMFTQYESKLVPKYKRIDKNKTLLHGNYSHTLKNDSITSINSNYSLKNISKGKILSHFLSTLPI